MAKEIERTVIRLAEEICQGCGIDVVDAAFQKEDGDWYLRVFIDKQDGVTIDDCEQVNRALSDRLDETDPIEQNYCLEVSSPGVDRILKKEREFLYYIGREVDVKLYQALDGKKEFSGILTAYKDHTAAVEVEGNEIQIPIKQAVWIRLSFRF